MLKNTRGDIGKLRLAVLCVVTREPALLEDVQRCAMFRVAERRQPANTELTGKMNDCCEHLSGKTTSPGVFGQDIAGGRLIRSLEFEAGTTQQRGTVPRPDQVRARWPPGPLFVAGIQERLRILKGLMPRPAEKPCDGRIAGVALEDRNSIGTLGLNEQQPGRPDPDRCLDHEPVPPPSGPRPGSSMSFTVPTEVSGSTSRISSWTVRVMWPDGRPE